MTWVFDHSPYTLAARLVHLAIADVVNDDHDHRVFIGDAKIGAKAMVSRGTVVRIKGLMVTDGYLEVLDAATGPGKFKEYRFLMPETNVTQDGTRSTRAPEGPNVRDLDDERARSGDLVLLPTKGEQKEQNGASDAERLCALLAFRMKEHDGKDPKISSAWVKDMDRLLRLGTPTWAKAEPVPPGIVAATINGTFQRLNVSSSSGFCWANVIRSPGNLRAKWDQLVIQLRAVPKPAGKDPLRRGAPSYDEQLENIRRLTEGKAVTQ